MKHYEAPKLDEIGSVADVTRGEGWQGNDDGFWIFSWGSDPSS